MISSRFNNPQIMLSTSSGLFTKDHMPKLAHPFKSARIICMHNLTCKITSWSFVALLSACFTLTGCIMLPVPTPENKVLLGQPVTDNQLAFLTPGVSTQSEVIEHFGNPNIIWEDEKLFAYHWDMRQGIVFWIAGGGYQGAAGMEEIPKHYLLLFQFDEQGRVHRYEKVVRPMTQPYADYLKEWVKNPTRDEMGQQR